MNKPSKWDLMVFKAWLARNTPDLEPRRHPPKAFRIYCRYADNIDRVEAWLDATRRPWWERK